MLRAAEASRSSSAEDIHFFCSSGGNAGLACATSALALGYKATIVVPITTSPYMVSKLHDLGAHVVQTGANWSAADRYLREELMAKHPGAVYVPPFDHPDIWAGAAPLVDELGVQLRGVAVDGIVCSVGGGGLMCGIMEGVERVYGRRPPTVLAVETIGADSLYASVQAGKLVTLPAITSIATSLGATRVAEKALEWALKCGDRLVSAAVSDADAVMASVRFLDDARILVEPACGATLAPAYNGDLRRYLGKGLSDDEWAAKHIVLVVCGGSNINLDILAEYRKRFGV